MSHSDIEHLNDENFSSKIEKGITLVDFTADWCPPCKKLAVVLEEVAVDVKGKVSINKLNIDANQKTTTAFQVNAFPTMILFKDGKEVGRMLGLRDAETVKNFILSKM